MLSYEKLKFCVAIYSENMPNISLKQEQEYSVDIQTTLFACRIITTSNRKSLRIERTYDQTYHDYIGLKHYINPFSLTCVLD